LEGSIIDNADISYMRRIEIQGGGILDTINTNGTPGAPTLTNTDYYDNLNGYLSPLNQFNSAFTFTISDSNIANFADAAVLVHRDSVIPVYRACTAGGSTAPTRGGLVGEPVNLYMYNNTISNSANGVVINATQGANTTGNTPYLAVLMNNTFYNNPF